MSIIQKSCTASLMIALCCSWVSISAFASKSWDLRFSQDTVSGLSSGINRGRNGRIAFERGPDIYTARSDGTDLINLTNGQGVNTQPAYSPDGSRIAFVSDRDGNLEIYTMNTAGGDVIRVTNNTSRDDYPDYSPDGMRLAFSSVRDGNLNIYSANIDGSGLLRLTTTGSDYRPAFSPDGTKIVFSRSDSQVTRIWIMDANDGSSAFWITTPPVHAGVDTYADFSPDGKKIVFCRLIGGPFLIYVIQLDTSALTLISSGTLVETSYSPDGTRILCAGATGVSEILPDGTIRLLFPDGREPVWQPIWRPSFIHYEGDRQG